MTLLEYFQTAFELEKSCYEQQRLINQTKSKISTAKNPKYYSHESEEGYDSEMFDFSLSFAFVGLLIGAIVGIVIGLIVSYSHRNSLIFVVIFTLGLPWSFYGVLIGAVVGAIGGFFVGIIIGAGDNLDKKKELMAVKKHNSNIDANNRIIFERAKAQAAGLNELLNKEIASLNETQGALAQLYSLDVIFPKYRNFVAVATIYEYLASGICTELGGPNGAYSRFEYDVKIGTIVGKLDQIINRLDQVIANQYMLRDAINDSNRRIDQLGQSITSSINSLNDNLENGIERISNNQQVGNFFGAISAANTSYLAKIERERQS